MVSVDLAALADPAADSGSIILRTAAVLRMVIAKPRTGSAGPHAAIRYPIARAKPDATSEIVVTAATLAGTVQRELMPATELAVLRELVVPATGLAVPPEPVARNVSGTEAWEAQVDRVVLAIVPAIAAVPHVPLAVVVCRAWAREVTVVAAEDLVEAAEGLVEVAEADDDRKGGRP